MSFVEASRKSELILRFFLVRHGETQANVQHLVVGQSDSPLTEHGIRQAQALGASRLQGEVDTIAKSPFWRIYASDLPRTRHTTRLLLDSLVESFLVGGEDASSSATRTTSNLKSENDETSQQQQQQQYFPNVQFDPRLREIAKGARQGYPKVWSIEQAIEERKRVGDEVVDLPLLESLDDGFERIYNWWRQVLREAVSDKDDDDDDDQTCSSIKNDDGNNNNDDNKPRVRNILVVAHAGIFRIFLQRLLGEDRLRAHPDARYDPKDGRFAIPNASLTILQVSLTDTDKVEVIKLTDASHYMQATVNTR